MSTIPPVGIGKSGRSIVPVTPVARAPVSRSENDRSVVPGTRTDDAATARSFATLRADDARSAACAEIPAPMINTVATDVSQTRFINRTVCTRTQSLTPPAHDERHQRAP
jgi:hypothetical protein